MVISVFRPKTYTKYVKWAKEKKAKGSTYSRDLKKNLSFITKM